MTYVKVLTDAEVDRLKVRLYDIPGGKVLRGLYKIKADRAKAQYMRKYHLTHK